MLRGPGSVLYGSNALHGMINIITPEPAEAEPYLNLWTGPHDYITTSGLVHSGTGLLAAHIAHDGGYRDNSGYEQQKLLGRYQAHNDERDIGIKLSWQNLQQNTAGYVVGDDAYKNRELSKSNANPEAFRNAHSSRAAFTYNQSLNADTSFHLDAYCRDTGMRFLMHFVPGQALEENGHQSIGLLNALSIENADNYYRFGFDLDYSSGYLRETQQQETVFSFVQGKHYDYDVTATVMSPYISADWRLGKHTRLKAGLRYDATFYSYHNNMDNGVSGRFLRIPDRNDRFHMVTPGIALLQKLNNTLNAYLRLARGTRAPQATDLYRLQVNQQAGEIKPETLDMLEIGLKQSVANAYWNIALFTMRKNHFFFRDADGFNVTDGKTSHSGIELEFNVDAGTKLFIAGGLSYTKHLYKFNRRVSSETETIHKGNDVDTAPRWLGNLRLGYRPEQNWLLELEWRHVGKYFTDAANEHSYPGHDVGILRTQWNFAANSTLQFRINNITNTRYAERADYAFGNERYLPGEERALYAGINLGF